MKRILFTMLIANALIILSLSSCKKENLSPAYQTGGRTTPITGPFTIDLVANDWANYGNEIYVNNFQNIISTANASGNRTVYVYLVENAKETQINLNTSRVTFMGHELWATTTKTDVKINYKSSDPGLPFESLNIKVVVE